MVKQRDDGLPGIADLPSIVPLMNLDEPCIKQAIPDRFALHFRRFQLLLKVMVHQRFNQHYESQTLRFVVIREMKRIVICRAFEVIEVGLTELDAVNANELMDMEFQPTGWLIEKLLGKGVYLLAGASKIGKSWLVLWLADRVSKGEKVWDFKTAQCDVLYVSLEDTAQRIQRRLSEVTGGEADRVWIATEAELLGSGFEQQLGNFLTAHPDVGFVIIDTLQRIRQMKTEKYSYSGDYEVMTALKAIADRFNITILVVHHTRKEESEDAFNMISGTNGLMGCADGAMVLQKPSRIGKTATLDVTGREVADLQLRLEFDDTKHWQFIEYGKEEPRDDADKLLSAVQQLVSECRERRGTPTELVSALSPILPLDTKPHSLTRRLNASSQALAQQYGVQYQSHRTKDSREITLSPLAS